MFAGGVGGCACGAGCGPGFGFWFGYIESLMLSPLSDSNPLQTIASAVASNTHCGIVTQSDCKNTSRSLMNVDTS